MIIVDRELMRREESGDPIRVAIVGAGTMGRAVALQIVTSVPGMRLAAVASRTLEQVERAYRDADVEARSVSAVSELERAVASGVPGATDDALLLCRADGIDAVIDATGDVELGAHVAREAINHRKHVVLMNAELDATLGPILKVYADRAGIVLTGADGDEPAVAMNLYRFVRSIGLDPVLAGNIKGFYDPYRTPATQEAFAAATGQKARMVTSFADGTKLSLESTVLANATGLRVGRRGMFGHQCAHVRDVVEHFGAEELRGGGLVDFVLGAEPSSGAFVVGYCDDPRKAPLLRSFKLGDGPLYVFYRPFHLPHLEVPLTVARAVLFGDAAVVSRGAPVCEVVTVAKRDLRAGEVLDGIGGFDCYGLIDNADGARAENLLPMGLSGGCRLERDVARDQAIRFDDVELPGGRLADGLWAEQTRAFEPVAAAAR
jgi:predicted homoserine dehydrogenase-like protein